MAEIPRWARWMVLAATLGVLLAGCSDDGEEVPTVGTEEGPGPSSTSTSTSSSTSTTSSSSGGYGY